MAVQVAERIGEPALYEPFVRGRVRVNGALPYLLVYCIRSARVREAGQLKSSANKDVVRPGSIRGSHQPTFSYRLRTITRDCSTLSIVLAPSLPRVFRTGHVSSAMEQWPRKVLRAYPISKIGLQIRRNWCIAVKVFQRSDSESARGNSKRSEAFPRVLVAFRSVSKREIKIISRIYTAEQNAVMVYKKCRNYRCYYQ